MHFVEHDLAWVRQADEVDERAERNDERERPADTRRDDRACVRRAGHEVRASTAPTTAPPRPVRIVATATSATVAVRFSMFDVP